MKIQTATLDTCHTSTGIVIVIDVLRAFTTAAFAFAAGAKDIVPVSTVEEAFTLRQRYPGSFIMGEVGGLPPIGFDFGNSPAALIGRNLTGRRIIQRTGAGTQGIARSINADTLLAASFPVAGATARYIQTFAPDQVTFVITGAHKEWNGDEDLACADYIANLLMGNEPKPASYLQRVQDSSSGQIFVDPSRPEFEARDLKCAMSIDLFDFAMCVYKQGEMAVMKPVYKLMDYDV